VAIHFCIRLRGQGQKILPECPGNPMFLIWALFWEIGLFRYPMKVSPLEQIRRAQRWGVLVLSSVLPCMAGAGKTCEKKPEPAPQHQLYKGLWSHVSFSTNMLSEYLGLDGGRFFNAAVEQSSATVSLPCGFYIVGIDSEPVANRGARPNYGRELDGMVGWKRTFGNYSVDVSATYLDVVPLGILPRGDVVQFSERVTRRVSLTKRSTASPYLWLRQAMPTRGPTPVGGSFVHGGATFSQTLSERVSASLALEVVHDSGAFGYRPGYIGRMVWGMNWKRGRGVSVQIPQVTVTDPLSHTHDGRHREVAVGVGITISPGH
jgi:hypothetical protein